VRDMEVGELVGAGAGWGGTAVGSARTKLIWLEVVWGEGFRGWRSTGSPDAFNEIPALAPYVAVL